SRYFENFRAIAHLSDKPCNAKVSCGRRVSRLPHQGGGGRCPTCFRPFAMPSATPSDEYRGLTFCVLF
ncbi:MAG: hypothetical protein ACK4OI_20305, partial [Rhizobium oryzihabitans]